MSKREQNSDSQVRGSHLISSEPLPGSLDVDTQIRAVLSDSIHRCKGKKREQIAEEMTYLLGREVTAAMLDAYTAKSKREHRWPAAWTAAFCRVTGDNRLARVLAESCGYRLMETWEEPLLRLGERVVAGAKLENEIVSLKQQLLVEARGK